MGEKIGTLLQLLLTALGAVPLTDGVLGVAAVLVAVTVLALVVALAAPHSGLRLSVHPGGAVDATVLLAQSDPDADGHPRPRAPGFALAA
ncbi:DUF6412 domain-containing protein [Microbacterium sp.]|uniref:DUF6412 domain-containing protein n=1 Tax=Microbacterium sp. TaxID=51671 RepID=UPI00281213BD|nr:DUF6412 domain-containing protein [Microbacterium sp.]